MSSANPPPSSPASVRAATPAARPVRPIRTSAPRVVPIFVINLARDRERMDAMRHRLGSLGLEFERVEAFDGPALLPRLRRWSRREFYSPRLGRPMTPGEVGCTLSHLRVLRAILGRRVPQAIILEDDVLFAANFVPFVENELPRLLTTAGVVKLEGIRDRRSSRRGVRLARSSAGDLFVPLRPALGSAGYAVTAPAARRLFQAFKRVNRPVDHLLGAYEQHGARYAELADFPVQQQGRDSNIKAERQRLATRRPGWTARLATKLHVGHTACRRLLLYGWLALQRS